MRDALDDMEYDLSMPSDLIPGRPQLALGESVRELGEMGAFGTTTASGDDDDYDPGPPRGFKLNIAALLEDELLDLGSSDDPELLVRSNTFAFTSARTAFLTPPHSGSYSVLWTTCLPSQHLPSFMHRQSAHW
jgi:hypothetical protein